MLAKLFQLSTSFLLFELLVKRYTKVKHYKIHLTVIFIISLLDTEFFTISDKIDADLRKMINEKIPVDVLINNSSMPRANT